MKLRAWISAVFTGVLALFGSSGLALAQPSTFNAPNHSSWQAFEPLTDGDTPRTLYTIPTLPSPTENNNSRQVQSLVRGMDQLGVYTDELRGLYDNPLITIVAAIAAPEIPSIRERAQRLESQFTNRAEVNKAFKALNQFKVLSPETALKIRRPDSVVDTFSASTGGASGAQVTIPVDFMYKVAQINLAQIPDFESYVFSLKDESDPDSSAGDYQLILNNQNNELKNIATSSESQFTLAELAANNTLFIRDRFDGHVYDFASQETPDRKSLADVIHLATTADNSMLEIMVKPSSADQVVHFGVGSDTSEAAIQALTYGILDTSLSPIHTKIMTNFNDTRYPYLEDPLDPEAPLYDPTDTANDFSVFLNLSNWRQEVDVPTLGQGQKIPEAEHLRFFMAPGTKWSESLRFNNKGSDVFDGQNNILEINFGTDLNPDPSPSKYAINTRDFNEVEQGVAPISLSLNVHEVSVGDQTDHWLQVDLVLQKGVIQINPTVPPTDEQNYENKNWRDKFFFEPPRGVEPIEDITQNQRLIIIEAKADIDELYKHMIGYVYANWSRSIDSSDQYFIEPNRAWFPNPPAAEGYPVFPVAYEGYFENEKGAIVNKNTIYHQLVAEDPITGRDLLDAQGNPILIPNTGVNIVRRLVDSTNRYATWLENKFGITDDIREQDYYLMTDTSTKLSFIEKRIVNNTGVQGQNLMQISDAIVRYWSGGALTEEMQATISEIIEQLAAQNLPWDLERDVKDKNKAPVDGSNLDTSTPEWKRSLQIVMHIISRPLSEALTVLFKLEKDNFDTLKGGVLARYMGEYLATERDDAIGINPDVLGEIDTSQLAAILQNMKLYYAKSAHFTKVNNGSQELGSILTFITNNALYSRYLEDTDRQNFIDWFLDGQGDILKPESYQDPQKARLAQNMIHLLDKILTEMIGGNFRALGQIIDQITAGEIPNADYPDEIRKVVRRAIRAIVENDTTYRYEYFGGRATSTYVENLAIGRNLESIISKYLEMHPELSKKEQNVLRKALGNAAYDPNTVTSVGVNAGYYNIRYFVSGLSSKDQVPAIAEDLLRSDLVRYLSLQVPYGSEFIEAVYKSSASAKITIIVAGVILSMIGVVGLAITWRKFSRQILTSRSLTISRTTFGVFIVAALVLVVLGIFAPIG